MRTHVVDHPLVAHKLTALRDENTDSPTFRSLADELVTLLAYEATREVRVDPYDIVTPVAPTTGVKLAKPKPLVVPILRAGLGMLDGMMRLLPTAEVGFLGMMRNEETLEATTYAERLPGGPGRPPVLRARPDARHRRHAVGRDHVPHRPRRQRHHRDLPAGRARGLRPARGRPRRASTSPSPWSPPRWTRSSTRRATSCPGSATPATGCTASSGLNCRGVGLPGHPGNPDDVGRCKGRDRAGLAKIRQAMRAPRRANRRRMRSSRAPGVLQGRPT